MCQSARDVRERAVSERERSRSGIGVRVHDVWKDMACVATPSGAAPGCGLGYANPTVRHFRVRHAASKACGWATRP
eukprot:scaffold122206_cov28-Tisochrysis_lutea.AAC.1